MASTSPLVFKKRIENRDNLVQISLINGLRRTMMCDLPVYVFDEIKTIFYENTSVLDNEFLKTRLTLTPIRCDLEGDIQYENLVFTCNARNTETGTKSVYMQDFEVEHEGEKIDPATIFPYMDLPIARLKTGQSIRLESRLKKNNAQFGGAAYNPLCTCVHTFEMDEVAARAKMDELGLSEKDRIPFMLDDAYQIYKKNPLGNPEIYHFDLESVGHYDAEDVYTIGKELLITRLRLVRDEFRVRNSEKVILEKNRKMEEVYDLFFQDENDTLGNILSQYLCEEENVAYVGYRIPHPLKYEMVMKIRLKENNTREGVIEAYEAVIDKVIGIIQTRL